MTDSNVPDVTNRRLDRKLLLLYVMLAVVIGVSLSYIQYDQIRYASDRSQFEHAVVVNCNANRDNTTAFNSLLDNLIYATRTSDLLTDEQKRVRIGIYERGIMAVPTCPPTPAN